MKAGVIIVAAAATLGCGLRAAYLWRQSTKMFPEPKGNEPVDPYIRQSWWDLAKTEASDKSASLSSRAAWWTGATALLGFVTVVVSLWP